MVMIDRLCRWFCFMVMCPVAGVFAASITIDSLRVDRRSLDRGRAGQFDPRGPSGGPGNVRTGYVRGYGRAESAEASRRKAEMITRSSSRLITNVEPA